MQRSRCALVVAATPSLAAQLCAWLKHAGWFVSLAHSYAAAKPFLERGPDVLMSELELGDYNGLQLALRAQGHRIPAVVVGHHDSVLERDAEQLGCSYIRKEELAEHRFTVAVDTQLATLTQTLPAVCRNVEFARRPLDTRVGAPARRVLLN